MSKPVFTKIQLPAEQPDRCEKCPLCGMIPPSEREAGKRQSYCCLGKFPHPPISSKGIHSSAMAYKRMRRKLHRPCDDSWAKWVSLPNSQYPILLAAWQDRRLPFEKEQERRLYKSLFTID